MKKLILTCALLTSVSVLSFGQNVSSNANASNSRGQSPSAEKIAELRAKQYETKLNLNATQYKALYEAELEYINADRSFRSQGQEVPAGPANQMLITHDQRFKSALTDLQYQQYTRISTAQKQPVAPANSGSTPANH